MLEMNTVTLEGYGPSNLVAAVRQAGWKKTYPAGQDFTGVSLAGGRLSDTPDALCLDKFRLTLEAIGSEERVVIEGYHAAYMLENVRQRYQPTTFARHELGEASGVSRNLSGEDAKPILGDPHQVILAMPEGVC